MAQETEEPTVRITVPNRPPDGFDPEMGFYWDEVEYEIDPPSSPSGEWLPPGWATVAWHQDVDAGSTTFLGVSATEPGWLVAVTFRPTADGQPVAVAVQTVRVGETPADLVEWARAHLPSLGPIVVGADEAWSVRLQERLRVGALIYEATRRMGTEWGRQWMAPGGLLRPHSPGKRPGRRGRPDIYYAALAARYVELASETKSPTKELASELKEKVGTIRDRLSVARDRRLLTSAGRGRTGGALTAKAIQLLSEQEA